MPNETPQDEFDEILAEVCAHANLGENPDLDKPLVPSVKFTILQKVLITFGINIRPIEAVSLNSINDIKAEIEKRKDSATIITEAPDDLDTLFQSQNQPVTTRISIQDGEALLERNDDGTMRELEGLLHLRQENWREEDE